MSILGTLTLDLTAPTAQLSRDLDRAHQLAREAASKLGGVKPIWGIASSLYDDLRAARSILNSSLKGMESDIKGYSLQIYSPAAPIKNRSTNQPNDNRSQQQIDRLNAKKIVIAVDDSALTSLNAHLTLKEEHLGRVVSKFASAPITPTINTEQIDRLERILNSNSGTRTLIVNINGDELSKSVEKAIKKGFKGVKANDGNLLEVVTSAPKTIVKGFQQGIGLTYAQSLTKGTIKGLEEQFGASLDRVGQGIGDRAGKAGKVVGNGLLRRAGFTGTDEVKGKIDELNEAFVDLFPVGILEKKLKKIEDRLMKIIDNVSRLRPVDEQVQSATQLGSAFKELSEVPKQGLRNRRKKQLNKYAEQVTNSGIGDAVNIAEDVHTIVVATGGFAGQKGKSSGMVGKKIQSLMGSGYHVATVDNTDTDVSMPIQEAGVPRWLVEGGAKITKNKIFDGVNPDAVKMATLASQLQKQYPDKKIKFAGFSSGGIVAADATELYQAAGGKAEGVAIGSPIFANSTNQKPDTFSAVLREGDGVNKVAKKIEQATGIGLDRKVTTMTPGEGHELALYLSDPKSQRVILDRLGSKNEPIRNKSAADFDVVNYKEQATQVMGDLGYQLANPIKDPKVNRLLLEQKLAAIKETRSSIKKSLPDVQEQKPELIEYLKALNEANTLLSQVLKLPSIPIIGTPEPKPVKQQQPVTTNNPEPDYDPLVNSTKITALLKTKRQGKVTDDPWSDSYATPQMDPLDPFVTLDLDTRPEIDLAPKSKVTKSRANRRRNRQQQAVEDEFVEQPNGLQEFNRSISQTFRAGAETANAIAEGAKAGAQSMKAIGEIAKTGQETAKLIGEAAKVGQEGAKVLGEGAKAGSKIMQLVGNVADTASESVKLIGEIASTARAVIGGVGDSVRSMEGRADNLRQIGGAQGDRQLIGGMRTIQAIEGDEPTSAKQISGGSRLALPPSDDLRVSKEYMKKVENLFAQKKAAIYKALEAGDLALVDKLRADYRSSITRLEQEIGKGIDKGDRPTKEFYNSGGVKSQLTHKKRFAENIDVAADLIRSDASPSDIRDAQIVSDSNLRKLTAKTILKRRENVDTDTSVIDIKAVPVVDIKPTRSKQTNAKTIVDMMVDRKLKIEKAIEDGDLDLVRKYKQELDEAIGDGKDLVKSNPNNISLVSNFAAQVGGKEKFSNNIEAVADLLDRNASNKEVENQPLLSGKLKKSLKLGLKARLIDGLTGNNEAGFGLNPLAVLETGLSKGLDNARPQLARIGNIPGLGFLNTPVNKIFPNPQSIGSSTSAEQSLGRPLPGFRVNRSTNFSPQPDGMLPTLVMKQAQSEGVKTESIFSKLASTAKLGLLAFGGYTLASMGVPMMIGLAKSTLDAARSFETLQVKLASATDSAQSGRQAFSRIISTADKMGISRSAALEVGAGIAGTTFGTELQGAPSDRMTDQVLEFAKLRGLSKQQVEGFQLATTQTLGRENLSGQEVNQFIQSAGITDARSIAARGLGMTAAQFTKAQDSGIDSKRFMQALLSQGVQDAKTGEALASQTIGYKESKLSAKAERLSGTVGETLSPAYKAGVDLLTNSIEMLNTAIESSKTMLIGFAVAGLVTATAGLIKLGISFNVAGVASATFKSLVLANLATIGGAILKLGLQFAAFYLIGEGIQVLSKKWSNAGQEISDAADRIGDAMNKANGTKAPDLDKPKTAREIGGDSPLDSVGLFAQRNITIPLAETQNRVGRAIGNFIKPGSRPEPEPGKPIVVDDKQKADAEIREVIDKVSFKTKQSIGESGLAGKKAGEVTKIDRELAALDTERSGLYTSGIPDAEKIADVNKRYNSKYLERDKLISEVAPATSTAQESINLIKSAQAFIDDLNKKGKIGQDTYIPATAQLKENLEAAEKAQLKLNEATRSGLDNLTPWLNTLNKIASKFEDIGTLANTSRERLAIARNSGEISGGLTRGGAERQSVIDSDRITQAEIKARREAVAELTDTLNAKDPSNVANVQKAYGLDGNSSVNQINFAANNTTNISDKATLEKLAAIKTEQVKIASLDAGLSNSHAETYRRIYAENREAALFYNSLSQQIDPTGAAFGKTIAAITAEKNRFMAKLNAYGTGGFDVYTSAVLELMDVAKDRMTALAKRAADNKAALDASTNRDNDIAGKRQSDFDVTPGAAIPAVGKLGGRSANDTPSTATSQPSSKLDRASVSNLSSKESKSVPALDASGKPLGSQYRVSTEPTGKGYYIPADQYKAKPQYVPKRSKADPNGYVGGGTQSQVNAQLKQLTPVERKRFLTTTLSASGKTDLGLDDFDRKWNPSTQAGYKPKLGGFMAGTVLKRVDTTQSPRNSSQVSAQDTVAVTTPTVDRGKSTVATKSRRTTTSDFRDKSQVASDRIRQESIDKSTEAFEDSESGTQLKRANAERKLERESRLAKQAAERQARNQKLIQLQAIPAVSIQDNQEREKLSQQNSLIDNREAVTNSRIDMAAQIKDIELSIAMYNKLASKRNRTQAEQITGEELLKVLPKLAEDLPKMKTELARLQSLENNLPQNDAEAIAKLLENQKYALEVDREREEQDRRAAQKAEISSKSTNIEQQLVAAPLDQDLLKQQRGFTSEVAKVDAEIARVDSLRKIADRERQDSSSSPKEIDSAKKKVELLYQAALKNADNKQSQESVRAETTVRTETLSNRIAELKIGQAGGDLDVRAQQFKDKSDAPFANTRALDLELKQKLLAIENAKIERNKVFDEMRLKYKGSSKFNRDMLASVDRQEVESNRQAQIERSLVEGDTAINVRSSQKDRRGYLYERQQAVFAQASATYSSETTGLKQRGEDTRDREYVTAVTNRKNETSKQEFDLRQRRSQITELTPEADQERASLDRLIEGLQAMEQIDLSNLANQFDRFNQVVGESQKTATDELTKFLTTGKFNWKSVAKTSITGFLSQGINQLVPQLFSGIYRKAPKTNTPELPDGSKPTDSSQTAIGFLGNLVGVDGKTAANLQPVTSEAPKVITDKLTANQIDTAVNSSTAQPTAARSITLDSVPETQPSFQSKYTLETQPELTAQLPIASAVSQTPQVNIKPLEPQTLEPPKVTFSESPPQVLPIPTTGGGLVPDTGYQIEQLPLKGRKLIPNFKPKYDPNQDIAPPMPLSQYEGMPGYIAPKRPPSVQSQPTSNLGGGVMNLIGSLMGGKGGGSQYMGLISGIGGLFNLGFADGGLVPKDSKFDAYRSGEDPIGQALRKEGANSILATLTPGERVLTVSESRYYETMFPKGIKGFADGGVVGGIKPVPLSLDQRKIDNRGDTNQFNFDISGGDNNSKGGMTKETVKEFENAVTAVMLKHKRSRNGLVT